MQKQTKQNKEDETKNVSGTHDDMGPLGCSFFE